MNESIYENVTLEVEEKRAEDIVGEIINDNTIETPEQDIETETVETVNDIIVETENPAIDETVFEDNETITAEEIQGETAEPLDDIKTVEDITEDVGAEEDPENTPVIEEAVVPSYIRNAEITGTRENPTIAGCGREVIRPSLLQ